MMCKQLYQKGLVEKVYILLCRLVGDAQHIRQVIVIDFLAGIVDEMMGEFAERFDVTYLETLLYVFPQDGFYQTLHVRPFVAKPLHLGEAAVVDVVHEGALAVGICLGGDAVRVNPMRMDKGGFRCNAPSDGWPVLR